MTHAISLDLLRRVGRTAAALIGLSLLLGLLLGGCNTISGAGEDLESAGEAVTGTAEDTKDEL